MLKDNTSTSQHKQSVTLSLLSKTTKSVLMPNDDFIENFVVIPPDGGWGWLIVVMAFICNFLTDGIMYTFGIYLNEISETFQVLPTRIALVTSLMSGFYFVVGPLTCALTNRYGFRMVGILGGLIACGSFLLATIFINLTVFLVLIGVLSGIGFNMIFIPSLLIVGFYFERWRALATAVSVCGSSIGIMVFPPAVEAIMQNMHWTWKFRILSGLTLITSICAFTFRPIKPIRIEDKKVTFDNQESEATVNTERDVKPYGSKSLYRTFHNNMFPTASEFIDASSVYAMSRRLTDENIHSSDSSIARSVFINRTDDLSMSLSTVYELQNEEIKKKLCGKHYCRMVFCSCCQKMFKQEPIRTVSEYNIDNINRPMYRDDILYGGSLFLLPEYSRATMASGPSTKKSHVSYHLSVTRVATQRDIDQSGRCMCCPEAIIRTITTMMHFKLLKSPTFLVLTISGFLTMVGLYCPFIFLTQRASDMGISRHWATLLLTLVGVANTVGRILCGMISWFPKIDSVVISYVTLIITGGSIIASNYFPSLNGQITFAVVFGFNIASLSVLRSLVIVELLGLENLTNAFGITTLFYGIACFIGIPVAGLIQNYTGRYDESFIFSGSSILLSGILIIPLRRISQWEANNKKKVSFKP